MEGVETQPPLEVDPAVLENLEKDDYQSSGYDTSTASLTSSINTYAYENGRRYHTYFGADKNLHPNDELEQDRLDLHHEVFLLLQGRKLHEAPVVEPQRVLDVGTGTGIWAIDMADKHPSAEIIGMDLSPIQPKWVPPNCKFEVDDAELEWTYQPDFFDFVHIRNLTQAISDWPKLLNQAYNRTKPGGYIELAEIELVARCDDGTMGDNDGLKLFVEALCLGMEKLGRPKYVTANTLKSNLESAGFVGVKSATFKQPSGPWAKDPTLKRVGALAYAAAENGYHAYGLGENAKPRELSMGL
ncbi:S-adenosyl-L-methionine-dependent methyltransferase [Wilcoxina mikolae CBS 423.85]|nr:S-adenosyl-L-methionine-dependent methyltransferase [Wilcoxina mikolae CBS 423.85]